MNKQGWFLIMVRKAIILTVILFFCGFISFISVNGTDDFYGRSQVQNITYKLPDSWRATLSEKQFRLLEISLESNSDFSVILFSNIQGTADQNIQRWINQFQVDESTIDTDKYTLDDKTISVVELYGTYEVPNMLNRNATKEQFDLFQLYIDDELICKGTAPGGGGTRSWDMDHCKFFNAGGTQTPASPGTRKDLGTSIKRFNSIGDTTDISNVVEQTTRRDYVKDSAVFTHTKTNLAIGDHKIKIFYNTQDGEYNSGAFYGTTFNFS